MHVNFEFLKFVIDQIFKFFAMFNKLMNAFKLVFSAKTCFKVVVRSVKIKETIIW